jgi:hypothetical protein
MVCCKIIGKAMIFSAKRSLSILPEPSFRKFSLVVRVNPSYTMILDKTCCYCNTCDLLIVHCDQLEEQLAKDLLRTNPTVTSI